MSESYIQHDENGRATSFIGPDATNLVRLHYVASGLRMYAKFGMLLTRGATPTKLLKMAAEVTGKRYKRGEYIKAADDVDALVKEYRASIEHRDVSGATI